MVSIESAGLIGNNEYTNEYKLTNVQFQDQTRRFRKTK
jgi:hypothetical protein